nr:glycoside hydrolase family 19 protein [Aestuariivirga litoralis]
MQKIVPNGNGIILQQMEDKLQGWGPTFGLNSDDEILQFLAQLFHESVGLTRFLENLNYSSPARLIAVWPKRFPNLASAKPYAGNPQALANKVYASRMGNGDEASGDGWRYRGRGGLQATGRAMYQNISAILSHDFVANPDDMVDPKWILPSALAVAKILKLGSIHDFIQDTKALNGGTTGLAERQAYYKRLQNAFAGT